MNTFIWLGIVLLAWCRPIDIYYRKTKTVNGRVVSEHDYVKWVAAIAAVVLIVLGVMQ